MNEKFDPLTSELQIQSFWEKNEIRIKANTQNASGEKFYFLQGPPYTSGKLHIGHAWNHALKDCVLRYKRMRGFHVWDRGGFDMHGLPTESKVMAKHNLQLKPDIIAFGEAKFAEECQEFCLDMMGAMNIELKRLGITLDHDNAYKPIDTTYMEGVWRLIKKANEKNRLYRGKRTMGWDPLFATALAKHEMEYKEFSHDSVFVKFKLTETDNDYLVIWTTTPWTLPFNMGVMVNPEVLYVKVSATTKEGVTQNLIIAKDLVESVLGSIKDLEFSVTEEFLGETLAGKKYDHFWSDKLAPLKAACEGLANAHTVLLATEHVETTSGSGLVHCAPGCGPEDYEVGHKNGLIPFNEIDEHGFFPDTFGELSGLRAVRDDPHIVQMLKSDGVLLKKQRITHEYPHGERSKEPIIFRATEQWFFKIEDLKEQMVSTNEDISWVPEKSKNAFRSWLDNLRDNSITKQRFWGTPAPIWVNVEDSDDYIVVGSTKELKELGATVPKNLHKPFIDEVTFTKDGKTYKRIPDVLDVWIDAGSASWNSLNTLDDPTEFEKWFPADFIVEGKDQVRGWFNLLTIGSLILFDKPAFKNVFVHGFIAGMDGEKMSKSLGNIISPDEVVGKYGADTLRYYTTKIRAGEDISWSWDEVKQQYRNLSIMHNVGNYLLDLKTQVAADGFDMSTLSATEIVVTDDFANEEKYILSKLHSAIAKTTDLYDLYELHKIADVFEDLLLELSRTYIQAIRDKIQLGAKERAVVFQTLYTTFTGLIQIAHPIIPFATESWFLKLKEVFGTDDYAAESVHLTRWPAVNEKLITEELEQSFVSAAHLIQGILGCRDKVNIGVRWPLSKVIVVGNSSLAQTVSTLGEMIKHQTNVKELVHQETFADVTYSVEANFKSLGKTFGKETHLIATAIKELDDDSVTSLVKAVLAGEAYSLGIVANTYDITSEHVVLTKHVGDGIEANETPCGSVYLVTTSTPELESEGYAREMMRRIQTVRKDLGLQKADIVSAQVEVSEELSAALLSHEQAICDKCGLSEISYGSVSDEQMAGEIKAETFKIFLKV